MTVTGHYRQNIIVLTCRITDTQNLTEIHNKYIVFLINLKKVKNEVARTLGAVYAY